MGDLDALSGTRKQHRVLTDDVARPDRLKADGVALARPGDAMARKNAVPFEIAAQRPSQHLAHPKRGA